jgi:hypothetical protein
MKRYVRVTGVVGACLIVFGLAGCRQPDGRLPSKVGEQFNKTEDISRDLQNLAGKATGAISDLHEDLGTMGPATPPADLSNQLASALDGALAGRKLSDQDARRLADTLFVVVTARDLSRKQIEQLGTDLGAELKKLGVQDPAVERVTTAAYKLQAAMTTNVKRWYHVL